LGDVLALKLVAHGIEFVGLDDVSAFLAGMELVIVVEGTVPVIERGEKRGWGEDWRLMERGATVVRTYMPNAINRPATRGCC
jgi:hypothetical protein